ncbi:M23 family metallopeptidase [Shewanella sp. YLB-07]|uniref:M23 family metallopeptidase n=1 Tax=Shewanella sp. YLB-07 TaxID=2601268 RepID=UPI00128C703D|nr:M23 family metallopeptidase [Shewanella sp. YLB-07]MPY24180.1 M23 family metallopeptidase [Shewanella sp. YLB-07]
MKNLVTVSFSTINGSRHFRLDKRSQRGIRWAFLCFIFVSIFILMALVYLSETAIDAKMKQASLQIQSIELSEDLDVLMKLKEQLEQDLTMRESHLLQVSNRLGDLEHMLGVTIKDEPGLQSRLDTAAITSAVRIALLQELPNGAPVKNARISSNFGTRTHPITGKKRSHNGIDYAVNTGSPVYATADGVVEVVRPSNTGSGNFLRLQHSFGISSSYSHLQKFNVSAGAFIKKGDLIAYSGNTGLSSGPHLHYEVRFVGRPKNPRNFVEWDLENFDSLFEKQKGIRWDYLVKTVEQRVSSQLQLSSQKAAISPAS